MLFSHIDVSLSLSLSPLPPIPLSLYSMVIFSGEDFKQRRLYYLYMCFLYVYIFWNMKIYVKLHYLY